jgi:hypothetical protein
MKSMCERFLPLEEKELNKIQMLHFVQHDKSIVILSGAKNLIFLCIISDASLRSAWQTLSF